MEKKFEPFILQMDEYFNFQPARGAVKKTAKMDKQVEAVVTVLAGMGGHADTMAALLDAYVLRVDCGGTTARTHIRKAVDAGQIEQFENQSPNDRRERFSYRII